LRRPRQAETGADQVPDRDGLHRLRVQAREDPAAGSVRKEPVQCLADAQPLGRAVSVRDQNRAAVAIR
jgi:hypothetical protein